MAHYARVNSNNIVTHVTPIPNEMITDENGIEHEEWALEHLYETIPDSIGDRWIQTSYNSSFRKKYAGYGDTYDETLDAFISPKPFPSWSLDTETCTWKAPVPEPSEIVDGRYFEWREDILNWVPRYT